MLLLTSPSYHCWCQVGGGNPSGGGKTIMLGPLHAILIPGSFIFFFFIRQGGAITALQIPGKFWRGAKNLKLVLVTRTRMFEEQRHGSIDIHAQALKITTPQTHTPDEFLAFLTPINQPELMLTLGIFLKVLPSSFQLRSGNSSFSFPLCFPSPPPFHLQ